MAWQKQYISHNFCNCCESYLFTINRRQTHLSAPPVKYLSSPPVIEVLMRGLRSEQFNAQYNALWSAINITFQDGQTAVNGLVVAGVIPILNNLLLSGNDTIIANSAWLLSNSTCFMLLSMLCYQVSFRITFSAATGLLFVDISLVIVQILLKYYTFDIYI